MATQPTETGALSFKTKRGESLRVENVPLLGGSQGQALHALIQEHGDTFLQGRTPAMGEAPPIDFSRFQGIDAFSPFFSLNTTPGEEATFAQAEARQFGQNTVSTPKGNVLASPAPPGLYSSLVNVGGEIRNTVTGRAYSSPAELATDLGIQPHEIDWRQIRAGQPAPPPPERQPGQSVDDFTQGIDAEIAKTEGVVGTPGGTPITLLEIFQQRQDIQDTLARAFPNQDPLAAGTEANRWLNDWANREFAKEYPGYHLTQPEEAGKKLGSEAVADSTKARLEQLRAELGFGDAPTAPDLFTEADAARLEAARGERTNLEDELAAIQAEKLALSDEFEKFKLQQVGLPEGGRIGAITEEQRNLEFRLRSIERRELIATTKLTNRNSVIAELMGLQQQEYTDALDQYNTSFNQALSLYGILEDEEDELKADAKANLLVLTEAFGAQLQAGQITPDAITPLQRAQIEQYETQAGLPVGSTMQILGTMGAGGGGFEYKGTFGSKTTGHHALFVNPETGEIKTQVVIGAQPDGRRTDDADKRDSAFEEEARDLASMIFQGDLTREQAVSILRSIYPEYDENVIYDLVPDESV